LFLTRFFAEGAHVVNESFSASGELGVHSCFVLMRADVVKCSFATKIVNSKIISSIENLLITKKHFKEFNLSIVVDCVGDPASNNDEKLHLIERVAPIASWIPVEQHVSLIEQKFDGEDDIYDQFDEFDELVVVKCPDFSKKITSSICKKLQNFEKN
jgi:hypothetical protein